MKTHVPVSCRDLTYLAEIDDLDPWSLDDLEKNIKQAASAAARKLGRPADYYTIVGCIAGGEAGVDMADLLSEKLGVLSNGAQGDFANRRDKKVQQELVREKGMRAVRQASGEKFEEVVDFLKSEAFPVVLKPTDSAGSDGVKLCQTFEEAREHFEHLLTVEAVNGGYNTEVLCQEFLRGKEYVVDCVSRNGVHKVCMVWVYDKRPTNGVSLDQHGARYVSVFPIYACTTNKPYRSFSFLTFIIHSRNLYTLAFCQWIQRVKRRKH